MKTVYLNYKMHKTNRRRRKPCMKTTSRTAMSSIAESSSTASVHINDLPVELLSQILSSFSIHKLCCVIALVCKQWYSIASNVLLHKHLFISNVDLDDTRRFSSTSLPSIYRSNYLSSITLTECGGISSIFNRISPNYIHLKSLKLTNCSIKETDIFSLIDTFPNIQRLEIHENWNSPMYTNVDCFSHRVAFGTTLRTLNITLFNSKLLRIIAITCPSVVEFGFQCFNYTTGEDDLAYFLEMKKEILQKLVTNIPGLTHKTFQVLSMCTKLKSLGLFRLGGGDELVLRCISQLKDLTRVSFHDWTYKAAEPLAEFFTLKEGKSLETIDLANCYNANDTVLVSIANHKNTLKHLRLKPQNCFTDEGINRLLKECPNLQTLSLIKYENLCEDIVNTILTCLPNLRVLFLNDCVSNCARDIKYRIEKSNKRIQVLTDQGSFVSI